MRTLRDVFARRALLLGGILALLSLAALRVWAQENPSVQETLTTHKMLLDTLWVMVAAFLVFWMQAGFAYVEGGLMAIPGHSLPMAALGVFILWLGWFGFNPGSSMAADASIAQIALTTNLAAATGAIGALATSWILLKKPDVSMTLNGVLAGLVAITAPCAFVSPSSAAIIGLLGGIVVVLSVLLLDRMKVDDPVGAVSVHGVCGVLGTLALGLFAQEGYAPADTTGNGLLFGGGWKLLAAQATGVVSVFAWCVVTGTILFGLLKVTIGIRVSAQEEMEGLDVDEHGMGAYPDFVLATPGQFSVTEGTTLAHPHSASAPMPQVSSPEIGYPRPSGGED